MKKLILFTIIMLLYPILGNSGIPNSIVGVNANCDSSFSECVPLPYTQLTNLCTSNCPLFTGPSFTSVNRMWGSGGIFAAQCVTSTNEGVMWSGCTTQPFNSGGGESYTGTADGNVIGAARVVADCYIKKSTDNGTTWTTKYIGINENCATAYSANIKCIDGGTCSVVFWDSVSSKMKVLQSVDNGESWANVLTSSVMGNPAIAIAIVNEGGAVAPTNSDGSNRGMYAVGSTWSIGSTWTGGSCWGSFYLNNVPYGVCYSGAGSIYEFRNIITGLFVRSFTLPGAIALINSGGLSFGVGSDIVYTLATKSVVSGSSPIGIYVTRNTGVSYGLLATTPTSVNSMREGSIWKSPVNNCLYFSAGIGAMVGKIC